MAIAATPLWSRIIVASILMGVSNEFSSTTHCSRHRHDRQSHCSVARIGPAAGAGQESAAISPEISATDTAERRYPRGLIGNRLTVTLPLAAADLPKRLPQPIDRRRQGRTRERQP